MLNATVACHASKDGDLRLGLRRLDQVRREQQHQRPVWTRIKAGGNVRVIVWLGWLAVRLWALSGSGRLELA